MHVSWAKHPSIALLIAMLGMLIWPVAAQLYYPANGAIQRVDAVQLWYNGYWKHPGWINGTLVREDTIDCVGKIVVLGNVMAPYEPFIRKAALGGAIGVVILRNRNGLAGQGMYFVSGQDQSDLTIPVVEVYQLKKKGRGNLVDDVLGSGGLEVSIWPMENKWKKANDVTTFQVVCNVILSVMELSIFAIGLWRIHKWTAPSCNRILSIGPVCIILEMISALLRFVQTVVDPFFTFRTMSGRFGLAIITASVPFLLCSGILLTFFWAETLRASRVQASPFIAEYKKSAGAVIIILFLGEIITAAVRTSVPVIGAFNPAVLAQAFYVLVAIALVICYLRCAHQIHQRLSTGNHAKRKSYIRNMNIRFALSTAGYISFCLCLVLSVPLFSIPWGWKIIFNCMYLSLNFSGLLQVYSLQPPMDASRSSAASPPIRSHTQSGTQGDHGKSADSDGPGVPISVI